MGTAKELSRGLFPQDQSLGGSRDDIGGIRLTMCELPQLDIVGADCESEGAEVGDESRLVDAKAGSHFASGRVAEQPAGRAPRMNRGESAKHTRARDAQGKFGCWLASLSTTKPQVVAFQRTHFHRPLVHRYSTQHIYVGVRISRGRSVATLL